MGSNGSAMTVVYLAHPVGGDVERNLIAARELYRRYTEWHPWVAIVAPWITECELWDDADPEQRRLGLERCMAVVAKCDQIWLCGPRVSEGMALERDAAMAAGVVVIDRTGE